jgi:PncC family amidohydrolase
MTEAAALTPELLELGQRVGAALRARRETVAVAEGAAGGLISASLLSVAGASTFYLGGAVVYTRAAARAYVANSVPAPPGLRGASGPWAVHLARSAVAQLGATWGIGEGGAAGPTGNPYGDPPGHAWVAVAGAAEATRHVLTGDDDRVANMAAFAGAALALLLEQLEG